MQLSTSAIVENVIRSRIFVLQLKDVVKLSSTQFKVSCFEKPQHFETCLL